IIDRVKKLNPNLNKMNLIIEEEPSNLATFIKSKEYEGRILVLYETNQKTSSSDDIKPTKPESSKANYFIESLKNKNLGYIEKINKQNIIDRVKKLNPNLNKMNLIIEEEPSNAATFIKSKEYEGKILVFYQTNQKIPYSTDDPDPTKTTSSSSKITDLNELIIIKDIGEIEESNEKNIIARIRRLNPQLNQIDLTVENQPSETKAFIQSKEYPGKVLVNYTNNIQKEKNNNNSLKSEHEIFFIVFFVFLFILLFYCFFSKKQ
ncbi:hypothetical protein, partial [Columbia Basin potato purple top phytoplasma]|uniref:hypothetical protein n=1 Tax=Columbia Basin potato purple top phytoplasma TaxID=307134 RepID=UPI0023594570